MPSVHHSLLTLSLSEKDGLVVGDCKSAFPENVDKNGETIVIVEDLILSVRSWSHFINFDSPFVDSISDCKTITPHRMKSMKVTSYPFRPGREDRISRKLSSSWWISAPLHCPERPKQLRKGRTSQRTIFEGFSKWLQGFISDTS